MKSVENDIIRIINWYRSLPADYIDINKLMFERKNLSTYGVIFATEVARCRKKWKENDLKYEVKKNQLRIEYSTKYGTTKADWIARGNCEQQLIDVIDAESEFYAKNYLFKAYRDVLLDMNQRIAHIRDEYKQNMFYGREG